MKPQQVLYLMQAIVDVVQVGFYGLGIATEGNASFM